MKNETAQNAQSISDGINPLESGRGMTEQKQIDAATATFILEAMPPDYDTLHAPLEFDAIEAMAEQYGRSNPDMMETERTE